MLCAILYPHVTSPKESNLYKLFSLSSGVHRLASAVTPLLLTAAVSASAQVVIVPTTPQIGSSNPVTAEPLVTRPTTKPCVVKLFTNEEFADFNNKIFSYTPPQSCPGPWSKVVFTADFTVTEGIQFDRTASFYLGHANIYYGTTSEPSPTQSPSWHVERDVTDLAPIFTTTQSGEAVLGNLVNSTYTGIIYANAALEFYPTSTKYPAASVPDLVVPLPDAAGGAVTLSSTTSQLSQSVTLPTNVERAFLDVIAQSQHDDEFWYTCVPNDVTTQLQSCGNTPFRETEIFIDGTPAGVAPVYPWIFTGGLDPYLWFPLPGIQTLDFKPFRVDLTPFAGLLSDGSAHTVALGVFNANDYFLATANLLIYTDHNEDTITGAVTKNTLSAAPSPVVNENLNLDSSGHGTATVTVGSSRAFTISGYINTSHGKITTTVDQTVNFLSKQNFSIDAAAYRQHITQVSVTDTLSTTQSAHHTNVATGHFSYPLNLNIVLRFNPDGSGTQTVTADQIDQTGISDNTGKSYYSTWNQEEVHSTDTLSFDSSFNITGESGSQSSASDFSIDSLGRTYYLGLTSKGNVLTGITKAPPTK
jgi:hypothetical protein